MTKLYSYERKKEILTAQHTIHTNPRRAETYNITT